MGPDSDPLASVYQHCRVKGVLGFWVADSAVMPQVPRANTHAAAIMIVEGWPKGWPEGNGTDHGPNLPESGNICENTALSKLLQEELCLT